MIVYLDRDSAKPLTRELLLNCQCSIRTLKSLWRCKYSCKELGGAASSTSSSRRQCVRAHNVQHNLWSRQEWHCCICICICILHGTGTRRAQGTSCLGGQSGTTEQLTDRAEHSWLRRREGTTAHRHRAVRHSDTREWKPSEVESEDLAA